MEQVAEAAAAAAGGVFSSAALFPLEVIKTNLQALSKETGTAVRESGDENVLPAKHGDPRAASPPGTSAGSSGGFASVASEPAPTEARHVSRRSSRKSCDEGKGGDIEQNEQKGETGPDAAGVTGGGTPSIALVARDILRREGLRGFYRGVCYSMGQSGVEKAAYFYGYGWLKAAALGVGGGDELGAVADLALGYLAEAFHLPFTLPIEVVLTKIVTAKEKTNALAVIQGILSESGFGGFYKGIQAYVVLCLKPAIQYAVFNRLKAITLAYAAEPTGAGHHGPLKLTAVQAFVLGAISRAVSTVIVFPYIRAKVVTMSRAGAGKGRMPESVLASLVSILREEGFSALFQGITPEITRGVLSAALMLMVKEKIHSFVKGAIMGSSHA